MVEDPTPVDGFKKVTVYTNNEYRGDPTVDPATFDAFLWCTNNEL
jgi:hypothetical protein